jgi:hypothetical protein
MNHRRLTPSQLSELDDVLELINVTLAAIEGQCLDEAAGEEPCREWRDQPRDWCRARKLARRAL